MRKLLSLTLALLMVFALVPFSAKAESSSDYLTRIITEAKALLDSTVQSDDGSDVDMDKKWATADARTTLSTAIKDADAKKDSSVDDEKIAAANTLRYAMQTFRDLVKSGRKSSDATNALETAKADAKATIESSSKLEPYQKKALKERVDNATSVDEVKSILSESKDLESNNERNKSLDEIMTAKADAIAKIKAMNIPEAKQTEAINKVNAASSVASVKQILADLGTSLPTPNPNPNPNPTPQGYVTLTIYRNLNNGDYEYTVKSYAKGTYLYNVNPYGRVGYRVNGYSYSPNGSLINEYTKVEDLVYTTLYADWGYIGEDYYGYGYHRPNSLIYAMDKAKSFKRDYPFQIANVASSALKAEFDAAYNAVSDMYDNSYWGYYYGYYNDGRVYYRNGSWLTYNEYVARYGTYDMENYRRYNYNGRYDGYYRDLYERNGRLYSYNDYRNIFGRYPYDSERVTNRRGYWDAYYGWGGYGYEYYGSNYKARIERLIDAIRAIARQYPGQPIYTNYANLAYPTYSSDYYYGYNYYYGDNYTSDLKNLINKAESLRDRIKGYTTYEILTNLQTCIDDAYRALQGRSNYANAYENLKNAINRADNLDSSIYIRRAYMTGDPSGKFGPYETLTRAQVAQIVANLLKQSGKTTVYNPKQYKDVEAYRWYKEAVDLVTSYGIMTGTPGGLFEPNKLVSKAELVVTAARLKNYQPTAGNVFGLTSHYWAQGYIQTAVKNGWIDVKKGFVPDAPITRGETAHIFNGALGYVADQNYIIKFGPQMKKFNDVERGVDYYYDIMTATNTVSYQYVLGGISWLSHIRPEGMWTMNQYSTGKTIVPLN